MASTKQINEYLNKNEDINDRVQKIIDSIGKEDVSNNVECSENCVIDNSNLTNNSNALKSSNRYSNELLIDYYENITYDEKNNLVLFVNNDVLRNSRNSVKSVIANLLICLLNIIRCIGIVFARILFSESVVCGLYSISAVNDISPDGENGGDVNG